MIYVQKKKRGLWKLLLGKGSTVEVNKVLMQEEYDDALKDDKNHDKKIVKLGELNELAYKDLILLVILVLLLEKLVSSKMKKKCSFKKVTTG